VDERTRNFLGELERADEEVSATLAELDELADGVESLRLRALELEEFLARLPAERARLRAAQSDVERKIESAHERLESAERELAEAERAGEEARAASARNTLVVARDAVRIDGRRTAEIAEEVARIESKARDAERETAELEERARSLAESLRDRPRLAAPEGPRPGSGLAGVAAWASGARAALFVARGSLAGERDALLRQASELAALVLGEPLQASAAEVARRIEGAG
jgi:hypothetical protein